MYHKMLFGGIFVYFLLFGIINAQQQYRSLDGTNNNLLVPNAGASGVLYLNYKNAKELFADPTTASMLNCPHNYQNDGLPLIDKCTDILPEGTFPLPRCISDLADGVQAKRAQQYDESFIDGLKSKRKSSHMMTYWADFISFDIAFSQETEILNNAILIPTDDTTYLSETTQQITQINQPTLPFSRSYNILSRGTINLATAFVDGSSIYGIDETTLNGLRDPNNRCKVLLIYGNSGDSALGYLPKDINGHYIYGQPPKRGTHIFVDMIFTVFVREHNRRCDQLRNINGNTWDDETYFQEARKWVIALIQKINYLEYLPILMGVPLPEFTTYDQSLVPGIDTTFITTTMRYGHSEVSDNFNILNQNGEPTTTLSLQDVRVPGLLESFGVPTITASLALQRQEEINIFYSDFMRGFHEPNNIIVDMASLDHLRVRDRGVPFYNDVRELYGLSRVADFTDITQDVVVQERLRSLYSSVDKIEALVGGLAEDHVGGSNLGPLFQKSMQDQWTLIRNGDRFWFESLDAGFSRDEINEIRNTTWRDVILRNSPEDSKIPNNIWFVQPRDDFAPIIPDSDDEEVDPDGYPRDNFYKISNAYSIKWKIEEPFIFFKMRMESNNAWFGLGFNPEDGGMLGADFLIAWSEVNDIHIANFRSNGYQKPTLLDEQFAEKISVNISSAFMELQVKRPLRAPDTVPITNDTTPIIFAWNPNSNVLSYHGGNRGKTRINFFQAGISTSTEENRITLLVHGIYMFMHKNLQVIGGVGVISFGTAALAVSTEQRRTSHKVIGTIIYTTVFFQFGLGILTIWARSFLESTNRGIVRMIKFIHFLLGVTLMVCASINVYLGIKAYGAAKLWEYLYLGWAGLLIVSIAVMEYWYSFKNRMNCFMDSEAVEKMIRRHIPNEKYDRLPVISWYEVNQRVVQGAKLVVAENLVFDIRRWIDVHPGGARILNRVIGTDITNDFYRASNSEDLSVPYRDMKIQPEKKHSYSLYSFLERFNSKTYKSPTHQHSRFAAETLASMVVGVIEDSKDALSNIEEMNSNLQRFKRYTLIDKVTVTEIDAEYPVRKFTFGVNSLNENLPKFVPGDYLEILSHTKGQTVVRSYTALQGTEKEFSIIVKIYKNGLMSRHLDRQLEGFQIKVRGPFNIRENMGLLSPIQAEKSIQSSTAYNVLLNPNSSDGCWDVLFMICGGSGITPMIQLIEHHLENLKNGRHFQLFLLFANKRISDIIYPSYLDELVTKSNGKLNITYILSNPPSRWEYYHGRPNLDIIFTWISKHYVPSELSTHDDHDEIVTIPSLIVPIIKRYPAPTPKNFSLTSFMKSEESLSREVKDQSMSKTRQSIFEPRKYIEALKNDPTALKIMICGPPGMTKTINDAFDELNFPREKFLFIN